MASIAARVLSRTRQTAVKGMLQPSMAFSSVNPDNEDSQKKDLGTNGKLGSWILPSALLTALMPGTAFAEAAESAGTAALIAQSSVGPLFTKALMVLPPLCAQALFFSGYTVTQKIKKDKTTGDMTPLPFLSMYTNCAVWSMYGVMVGDYTILAPNLTGVAMGLYCTSVFHKYNSGPSLTPQYMVTGAIIAAVGAGAALLPPDTAATAAGMTGCGLAVLLMSSPLAVVRTVIAEKSTAAMPFATSMASFTNAASWTAYGWLVAHNPMVWAPNGLGLLASCVQLSLFAYYGMPPPVAKAKSGDEELQALKDKQSS